MVVEKRCVVCGAPHAACGHGVLPRYRPVSLERTGAVAMHTLKNDLYIDIDGNVVDERDPRVQTFVGAKGAEIPEEDAKRYGLIGGKKAEAVEHDEAHDPDNAADPVVAGEPTPDGDVEKQGRGKK
jgi:hypothetical protein